MLPAATRGSGPSCARIASTCSRPLSSGRIDRALERHGIDAVESFLQRVCLHGDDEERDRPVEARHHLRARDSRLARVEQRQPGRGDRLDAPLGADSQRARPRDEHAADPTEPEDRDGHGRHASAGSTTRFTYWVSE